MKLLILFSLIPCLNLFGQVSPNFIDRNVVQVNKYDRDIAYSQKLDKKVIDERLIKIEGVYREYKHKFKELDSQKWSEPVNKWNSGRISIEDINRMIDDFLEGRTSVSIEAIYKAIDDFFEQ